MTEYIIDFNISGNTAYDNDKIRYRAILTEGELTGIAIIYETFFNNYMDVGLFANRVYYDGYNTDNNYMELLDDLSYIDRDPEQYLKGDMTTNEIINRNKDLILIAANINLNIFDLDWVDIINKQDEKYLLNDSGYFYNINIDNSFTIVINKSDEENIVYTTKDFNIIKGLMTGCKLMHINDNKIYKIYYESHLINIVRENNDLYITINDKELIDMINNNIYLILDKIGNLLSDNTLLKMLIFGVDILYYMEDNRYPIIFNKYWEILSDILRLYLVNNILGIIKDYYIK